MRQSLWLCEFKSALQHARQTFLHCPPACAFGLCSWWAVLLQYFGCKPWRQPRGQSTDGGRFCLCSWIVLWSNQTDSQQLSEQVCKEAEDAASTSFQGVCSAAFSNALHGIAITVRHAACCVKIVPQTVNRTGLNCKRLQGLQRLHLEPVSCMVCLEMTDTVCLQLTKADLIGLLTAYNSSVASVHEDTLVTISDVQYNPPWSLDRLDQADLPLDNQFHFYNLASGVHAYIVDTARLSARAHQQSKYRVTERVVVTRSTNGFC